MSRKMNGGRRTGKKVVKSGMTGGKKKRSNGKHGPKTRGGNQMVRIQKRRKCLPAAPRRKTNVAHRKKGPREGGS